MHARDRAPMGTHLLPCRPLIAWRDRALSYDHGHPFVTLSTIIWTERRALFGPRNKSPLDTISLMSEAATIIERGHERDIALNICYHSLQPIMVSLLFSNILLNEFFYNLKSFNS